MLPPIDNQQWPRFHGKATAVTRIYNHTGLVSSICRLSIVSERAAPSEVPTSGTDQSWCRMSQRNASKFHWYRSSNVHVPSSTVTLSEVWDGVDQEEVVIVTQCILIDCQSWAKAMNSYYLTARYATPHKRRAEGGIHLQHGRTKAECTHQHAYLPTEYFVHDVYTLLERLTINIDRYAV
jgi:hypothetical protein